MESEQLERGIEFVSDSDEETDVQAHCLHGYGGTSGSESDLPEPTVGGVCTGFAADFV